MCKVSILLASLNDSADYFSLLRSQITGDVLKDPQTLDSLSLLKDHIMALEQEQISLQSINTTAKRTIKELEDGIPLQLSLILELQSLKDAQEDSSTINSSRKKKRRSRQEAIKFPSVEVQRKLAPLGTVESTFPLVVLITAAPAIFHSVQLLLYPETPPEVALQAAYILRICVVAHLKRIITNPASQQPSVLDPTSAIQSIVALLAVNPTFSEITMDLVSDFISLLKDLVSLSAKSNSTGETSIDYRDSLVQGVLAVCTVTPTDSPIRQALLLCLLVEFREVRCAESEDGVDGGVGDKILWYLHLMIEQVVCSTERLSPLIAMQAEQLIWDSLSTKREDEMTKANWLTWKVCGLLCGIGMGVDVQEISPLQLE